MTNNKLANKLLDMREQIEDAKVERNKKVGRQEEQHKRSKKEFGCRDLKAITKELTEMEQAIQKGDRALNKGVTALENDYKW